MTLLLHEVAAQSGIHPQTVRRLKARGLITCKRDHNGWRRYSPDVVEKLKKLYVQDDEHPVKSAS
jgi:DNA-binding transcriptional MerR regulator